MSEFNLLSVGNPTYFSSPRPPVLEYIERCSNLEKTVCLVFATGGETPHESTKKMQGLLEAKGAKVISSLALLTEQKNQAGELAEEFVEKAHELIQGGS